MKQLIVMALAGAALALHAEVVVPPKRANETPEEKKARLEAVKARYRQRISEKGWDGVLYEINGEQLVKPNTGKGKIVFVNAQSKMPADKVSSFVRGLSLQQRIRMEVVAGKDVTLANAAAALKANGAQAAVFLVDSRDLPPTLVAYDSMWAMVNVAAFGEGPAVLVNQRIQKALYRSYAILCGAPDIAMAGSLLWPATRPEDFDLVRIPNGPIPALMQNIEQHLDRVGIKPIVVRSYRKACEEGWAPAPTNDVQKAIWDKVHTVPTEPIKIKYEGKKTGK